MFGIKILGVAMLALPAVALAQVGPNPAVPGGSQSPTVGGSGDMMTAPQDARVGARASGQVLDRSTTTTGTTTTDTGTTTSGPTTTSRAGSTMETDANPGGTGTSMGTQTRTKTHTKGMKKPRG